MGYVNSFLAHKLENRDFSRCICGFDLSSLRRIFYSLIIYLMFYYLRIYFILFNYRLNNLKISFPAKTLPEICRKYQKKFNLKGNELINSEYQPPKSLKKKNFTTFKERPPTKLSWPSPLRFDLNQFVPFTA